MNIIATTDLSTRGSDFELNKNISIIEKFGIYSVICFERMTGCMEWTNARIIKETTDRAEAVRSFTEYGGCKCIKANQIDTYCD